MANNKQRASSDATSVCLTFWLSIMCAMLPYITYLKGNKHIIHSEQQLTEMTLIEREQITGCTLQIPKSVLVGIVLVGIGIGMNRYWQEYILVGIGIGRNRYILVGIDISRNRYWQEYVLVRIGIGRNRYQQEQVLVGISI